MANKRAPKLISHTFRFSTGAAVTVAAGMSTRQMNDAADEEIARSEATTGHVLPKEAYHALIARAGHKPVIEAALQIFSGPKDSLSLTPDTVKSPLHLEMAEMIGKATAARVLELRALTAQQAKDLQARDAAITNLRADVAQRDRRIEGLRHKAANVAPVAAAPVAVDPRIAELEARLGIATALLGQKEKLVAGLLAENDMMRLQNTGLRAEVQPLRSAIRRLSKGVEPSKVFAAPNVQRMDKKPDVCTFPAHFSELPEWVEATLQGKLVLHEGFLKATRHADHIAPNMVFKGLALLAGPWRDMRLDAGNHARKEVYNEALRQAHMDHRPTYGIEGQPPRKDVLAVTRQHEGQEIYCDWHLKRPLRSDRTVCLYHAFQLLPETSNRAVFVGFGPKHI